MEWLQGTDVIRKTSVGLRVEWPHGIHAGDAGPAPLLRRHSAEGGPVVGDTVSDTEGPMGAGTGRPSEWGRLHVHR